MRNKPIVLSLYSYFFLFIAISLPIQVSLLYDHSFSETSMIFNKISYLNWLVIGVCLLNAYLSFNAHWMLKISLPFTFIAVTLNNFYVSWLASDFSFFTTSLASFAFVVSCSFFFTKPIQNILNNQSVRWWLIPKRFKRTLPVWVQGPLGSPLLSKTYDISSTGAFLAATSISKIQKNLSPVLREGDEISFTLGLSGQKEFSCHAEVVRLTQPKGSYPGGVGIKFKDMSLSSKLALERILDDTACVLTN